MREEIFTVLIPIMVIAIAYVAVCGIGERDLRNRKLFVYGTIAAIFIIAIVLVLTVIVFNIALNPLPLQSSTN